MSEGALDQGGQLLAIAGKAPGHVSRVQSDRELRQVDGQDVVDLPALHDGSDISRDGELSFCQTINAVVFDDINNIHIAAHHVTEIPQADNRRIAIARYADKHEGMISQIGAGGYG